jgi:hypothetical protein
VSDAPSARAIAAARAALAVTGHDAACECLTCTADIADVARALDAARLDGVRRGLEAAAAACEPDCVQFCAVEIRALDPATIAAKGNE